MIKKNRPIPELSEKREKAFWSFVELGFEDGCWHWKGAKNNRGYGQFRITGYKAMFMAHRISYRLVKGPIPEGYVVMHMCDNRACVSPLHLTIGEQQENMKDMINKGRAGLKQYAGEDVPF